MSGQVKYLDLKLWLTLLSVLHLLPEIDECHVNNPCDATHSTCVNKGKFFECQCKEPWIPDIDGLGCSGKCLIICNDVRNGS